MGKTIKRVFTADGQPVVTKLPNGQFDVLCYGNEDGKCRGCAYKRKGMLCGCPCTDKDHIHWIFTPYVAIEKSLGTRVKRANEWDYIVTEKGDKYQICFSMSKSCGFEVIKVG